VRFRGTHGEKHWLRHMTEFTKSGVNLEKFRTAKYDIPLRLSLPLFLVLLHPLRWRCVECAIHHEAEVREEQHPRNVARTSNN